MAPYTDGDSTEPAAEADMAQAFKDLARGEQTASAMENHLTAIERKIDELLKKAGEDQKSLRVDYDTPKSSSSTSVNGHSNNGTEKRPNERTETDS